MVLSLRLAALVLLVFVATPVQAANPVEACTHKSWGFLTFNNHQFGTVNTCPYAVTVWFMRPGRPSVHADVLPGGYFDTGLRSGEFDDAAWSAAICRAGHSPMPAADQEHWDQILNGDYRCVKN
ncbi:MAG: hypothetical protein JSR60_16610 [Proteobacteria bacterium]|nr:hypothetical protein [Pseudomonadota bacterium]